MQAAAELVSAMERENPDQLGNLCMLLMKRYKMPISITRSLTAPFNILVLVSSTRICKGLLAKGTVNIQKGKFCVTSPVLSWRNSI